MGQGTCSTGMTRLSFLRCCLLINANVQTPQLLFVPYLLLSRAVLVVYIDADCKSVARSPVCMSGGRRYDS